MAATEIDIPARQDRPPSQPDFSSLRLKVDANYRALKTLLPNDPASTVATAAWAVLKRSVELGENPDDLLKAVRANANLTPEDKETMERLELPDGMVAPKEIQALGRVVFGLERDFENTEAAERAKQH